MLEQLNSQFAIEDKLTFRESSGGLIQGSVSSSLCQAKFYLHGGHVAEFQPLDQAPILFMSEKSLMKLDAPIRGGIPICFPWFGPHPSDSSAPAHGWARTSAWSLLSSTQRPDETLIVQMGLSVDQWELKSTVEFSRSLVLSLSIRNAAQQARECEIALHTYFALSDVHSAAILGLENQSYLDKLTSTVMEPTGEAIRFVSETDRVYRGTVPQVLIDDRGNQRQIRIEPENSRATVVWNPWIEKSKRMPDFGDEEYLRMCCVETANVAAEKIELGPAQSTTIAVRIGI